MPSLVAIPPISREAREYVAAIIGDYRDKIVLEELTSGQAEELLIVVESEWDRAKDPVVARELSGFAEALVRSRKTLT